MLGSSAKIKVKTIQTGIVTIANGSTTDTGTLSPAVTTGNTMLIYGGCDQVADGVLYNAYIELTNGTTVTATRNSDPGSSTIARFTAVEFYSGAVKSIQRGTINIPGSSVSNTATITSVDTSNAFVSFLGNKPASNFVENNFIRLALTNATTVTATKADATGTSNVSYEVVEFY